jgi:hypothetical protein
LKNYRFYKYKYIFNLTVNVNLQEYLIINGYFQLVSISIYLYYVNNKTFITYYIISILRHTFIIKINNDVIIINYSFFISCLFIIIRI